MQAAPHLQWKPLINLSPAQVAELLKESKVYVDFGEHLAAIASLAKLLPWDAVL